MERGGRGKRKERGGKEREKKGEGREERGKERRGEKKKGEEKRGEEEEKGEESTSRGYVIVLCLSLWALPSHWYRPSQNSQ